MSKNLEYVIMAFLAGLLVILFRWSENNNYDVISNGNVLINNRSGEIWHISSGGKKLIGNYKPTPTFPDFRKIADSLRKEYNKVKE